MICLRSIFLQLLYLGRQALDDLGHVAHGRLHLTHQLLLRLGRGDDAQLHQLVIVLLSGALQLRVGRCGLADELLAVAKIIHLPDVRAVDSAHQAAGARISCDCKLLIHSAPPLSDSMIQKIRTAKLPGNCLYSALKLP